MTDWCVSGNTTSNLSILFSHVFIVCFNVTLLHSDFLQDNKVFCIELNMVLMVTGCGFCSFACSYDFFSPFDS